MPTYVVDGYNALFRLEADVPEDRDASREILLRRVRAAMKSRGGGDRVEVLLDSRGGDRAAQHGREGNLAWAYVRGSADEAILRSLTAGDRDPGDTVVVTDDRELRGRARQRGARVLGLDDFFSACSTSLPPERPLPGPTDGPPLTARDFGLPDGPIDLTDGKPPRRR